MRKAKVLGAAAAMQKCVVLVDWMRGGLVVPTPESELAPAPSPSPSPSPSPAPSPSPSPAPSPPLTGSKTTPASFTGDPAAVSLLVVPNPNMQYQGSSSLVVMVAYKFGSTPFMKAMPWRLNGQFNDVASWFVSTAPGRGVELVRNEFMPWGEPADAYALLVDKVSGAVVASIEPDAATRTTSNAGAIAVVTFDGSLRVVLGCQGGGVNLDSQIVDACRGNLGLPSEADGSAVPLYDYTNGVGVLRAGFAWGPGTYYIGVYGGGVPNFWA